MESVRLCSVLQPLTSVRLANRQAKGQLATDKYKIMETRRY